MGTIFEKKITFLTILYTAHLNSLARSQINGPQSYTACKVDDDRRNKTSHNPRKIPVRERRKLRDHFSNPRV